MNEDFSINGIKKLVEKIIGGDARSTTLRSGLPEFAEEL